MFFKSANYYKSLVIHMMYNLKKKKKTKANKNLNNLL